MDLGSLGASRGIREDLALDDRTPRYQRRRTLAAAGRVRPFARARAGSGKFGPARHRGCRGLDPIYWSRRQSSPARLAADPRIECDSTQGDVGHRRPRYSGLRARGDGLCPTGARLRSPPPGAGLRRIARRGVRDCGRARIALLGESRAGGHRGGSADRPRRRLSASRRSGSFAPPCKPTAKARRTIGPKPHV